MLTMPKPGTIQAASKKSAPFRNKEKSPRVRILRGKEMSCKIGLRKVLMMAMTSAATKAETRLAMLMPGIMKAVMHKAKSESKKRKNFDID